jgi:hypothetical protein
MLHSGMDEIKPAVWFSGNVRYGTRLQDVRISKEDQKKASGNSDVMRSTPKFFYKTNRWMNSDFYLNDFRFNYVTLHDKLLNADLFVGQ